jgi:hypothetical protein
MPFMTGPPPMLKDICCWEAGRGGGGVAVGVDARDWEVPRDGYCDWEKEQFMEEECSCRANVAGGCGYVWTWTIEAIRRRNGVP